MGKKLEPKKTTDIVKLIKPMYLGTISGATVVVRVVANVVVMFSKLIPKICSIFSENFGSKQIMFTVQKYRLGYKNIGKKCWDIKPNLISCMKFK